MDETRLYLNSSGKVNRIQLFDNIGSYIDPETKQTVEGFTLAKLDAILLNTDTSLLIEIKTNGGDVFEAFAIYDRLRLFPVRIQVDIVGTTASAGTIIASAGDRIRITENSKYLVHNARTRTEGTKEDMLETYEAMKSIDEQIARTYVKRTGKDIEDLQALMIKDRYMTAQEALAWGFVDEIIAEKKKILNYKPKNNKKMNKELFLNLTEEEQSEMDALIAENEALKAKVAELEAAMAEAKAAEEKKEEEEITSEVQAAAKAGKITAEAVPSWIAMGKANRTAMTAALAGVKVVALKDVPRPGAGAAEQKKVEAVTKEKFVENLKANLYTNDVEKYRKDFVEAYGYEPSI